MWDRLEEEGLSIAMKLAEAAKQEQSVAALCFNEFEEFKGRLDAALAAAKVQKDSFSKWVTENL